MSLAPEQIAEINGRRDIADLARELGASLRKSGGRLVGSCPICGGGKGATRFEIKNAASWVCAVCSDGGDAIALVRKATGCDFRAAVERLGGARALSDDEARRVARQRAQREEKARQDQERYRARARRAAAEIWARARPAGRIVRAYLAARCCDLPASAMLRESDDLAYVAGVTRDERGLETGRVVWRGPAMVAAILDNDGVFIGAHRTWVAPDLSGKARIADPETGEVLAAKKSLGSSHGGHIILRDGGPAPRRLFIGEGIETVLSVATALRRALRLRRDDAFWSSVDLGNLGGPHGGLIDHPALKTATGRAQRLPGPQPGAGPAIVIPDSVAELILLGDGDSERVLTDTTLERARRRYARPGLTIRTAMAPDGGDFNDVLTRAG